MLGVARTLNKVGEFGYLRVGEFSEVALFIGRATSLWGHAGSGKVGSSRGHCAAIAFS